jgi:hypothetical protein
MFVTKILSRFRSIEQRDNFIIALLSTTLILWLSWWVVPKWTGGADNISNTIEQVPCPAWVQQDNGTVQPAESIQIVYIKQDDSSTFPKAMFIPSAQNERLLK